MRSDALAGSPQFGVHPPGLAEKLLDERIAMDGQRSLDQILNRDVEGFVDPDPQKGREVAFEVAVGGLDDEQRVALLQLVKIETVLRGCRAVGLAHQVEDAVDYFLVVEVRGQLQHALPDDPLVLAG